MQEEDPYLGFVLNIKETIPDFLEMFCVRLIGGLVPYASVSARVMSCQSWYQSLGFPIYSGASVL